MGSLDQRLNDEALIHQKYGVEIIRAFNASRNPSHSYQKFKPVLDFLIALFCLITLSPALVFIAFLVKLDSKGPVFYFQDRWGKDCKIISVLKFRSMYADMCDASGLKQCVDGDLRTTRVGRFLRKYNLDELPQLYNVLKGDMSLVGPRCHAVGMWAAGQPYEVLVRNYHERHVVRPGITGLAQVRGLRGPTNTKMKALARFASDLHYIGKISFFMDLKILILTVRNEFIGGSGF